MHYNIKVDDKAKLALAIEALRRAESDLVEICQDDDMEIDPAFALGRVRMALKNLAA